MSILRVEHFGGYFTIYSNLWGVFRSHCDDVSYNFNGGVYLLSGEIDSGAWAFSSTLCSKKRKDTCIIDDNTKFYIENREVSLDDVRKISCDLDAVSKQMALTNKSVRNIVEDAIIKFKRPFTVEDVRKMFQLTDVRYNRLLNQVGNERFRCNAAIGFLQGKKIFCFPWFSKRAEEYYHGNIYETCNILAELGCTILMPCSELIVHKNDKYTYISFPTNRQM